MKLPRDAPKVAGRTFIDLSSEVSIAILRIVAAGWSQALKSPDVNADAGEVVMNERLRDGMRTVSDELPWGRTMIVLDGMESRSRPEVLTPDGRTDISILWIEIFFRYREHVPHAIIECKRISGDDDRLRREYVVNGIDRFRSGKYAPNHAAGFMVGYLIAGAADEAARGVNRHLNSDENLAPSNLIDEPWAWTSRHPRAEAPPIDLHHALLPFHGERDNHERALRRTSRMEFIGVDLAWDEGSDKKAANESGVVMLDATGRVVDAGWTRGVEETVAWVERNARDDALLFVDAALCAWTASVWVRWGKERCQVLGCDDSLLRNGLRAAIIAPCKDEQRAGR